MAGCSSIQENHILRQKEKIAEDLSYRIDHIVCADGFTPEWRTIKDKIIAGKDTLFFVQTSEVQIIVRQIAPNKILDSLTKIQDSLHLQDSSNHKVHIGW